MWGTLFFRLPRLTVLTVLFIIAGGLGAVLTLGRQEDPTLVERFGFVLTTLPGADAERVEALLSEPIENRLRELPEIAELNSTSRANVSQVQIQLSEDLNVRQVDDAWTLIRQQVELTRPELPVEASIPDTQRLYVGAATMLVAFVWEDDRPVEASVMGRFAQSLRDRFQSLAGTEETQIFGLQGEEIRVVLDSDALSAAGISAQRAAQLIAAADARAPAGRLRTGDQNFTLEVGGAFDSIARIRATPLLQRSDGTALRLGDIADVRKGLEEPARVINLTDGKRSLLVGGYIQTGQRVDQWAEQARAIVAEFSANAPAGIGVEIRFDQSQYTEARLGGLAQSLAFSALIVFLVLFFLMGWRSAIVVGLALPLTICLVLILFNVFGMPLHQMSVTGLVISLGLLIDNAIVVVDEYDQKRNAGTPISDAIDHSLKHLSAPLAASTLTTALAFVPIAVLPGSAGEFVGMLGTSVIFSVCSSFLVALTVIPAVAGWFDIGDRSKRKRTWWRDGVTVDWISDGYRWTIGLVLRYPPIGVLLGVVPALIGGYLGTTLPSQFFPQTDRDQMQLALTLSPDASIEETLRATERATQLLLAEEGVEGINWIIGEEGPRVYYNSFSTVRGVTSFASGFLQLDHPKRAREIVSKLQAKVRVAFPNAQFLIRPFEQGPPVTAPIEFRLAGDDLSQLNALGNELRAVLAETPGITYTTSSLLTGAPTFTLDLDEVATAMSGARFAELAGELNVELEGVLAGSILEGVEELPVRVIASDLRRSDLANLRSKTVGAGRDSMGTPLSALGEVKLVPDAAVITRRNGGRINRIQAFLEPYALPAPALGEAERRLEEAGFEVPAGYELTLGGEAEASGDASSDLAALAVPLIILILGAVALVFNSFRMAFIVLVSGALAGGMALFGVWLFNLPLGFNAIIGSLGLLGIAINGTIVVLTQLAESKASMADDIEAQCDIVVDATRHIVATTLTTMGGFVPLILAGDLFWLPLAAAIACGVFGSALLALYFAPAAFRLMTMKPLMRVKVWLGLGQNNTELPAE
ncbi:MAG: efflux RND transporter permease subunit [Hyphomonadaceae bacterium]